MRLSGPQIINGQQTATALAKYPKTTADVLVKIIEIPRRGGNEDYYDSMVGSIVQASNSQNAILPSDLVSNDKQQVGWSASLESVGTPMFGRGRRRHR